MTYTDDEIKRIIADQLSWDYRIGMSEIEVKVSGGEVTLEGAVPSYYARKAVLTDVFQVSGVTKLNDRMIIKFSCGFTIPSDGEIRACLLDRYLWHPYIEVSDIDLIVYKGTVKLRGVTDAYWKKKRTGEIACDVHGVIHVSNELAVDPPYSYADQVIAEEIMAALRRNFEPHHHGIDVQTDDGKVMLSGTVYDIREFYYADRIAEFTRGVRDVENLLRVG